jgi:hypothetical protein
MGLITYLIERMNRKRYVLEQEAIDLIFQAHVESWDRTCQRYLDLSRMLKAGNTEGAREKLREVTTEYIRSGGYLEGTLSVNSEVLSPEIRKRLEKAVRDRLGELEENFE